MATVVSLIAALQSLDGELPVGALRVERVGGEITSFHVNEVVEVHVAHHAESGAPVAAWVVTGLPSSEMPEVVRRSVPSAWTITRDPCGCVLPLEVLLERRISTLAVRCPHYEPSEMMVDFARRHPRR
jgi:hypothetical protein